MRTATRMLLLRGAVLALVCVIEGRAQEAPDISTIIEAIRRQEQGLLNIQVRAHYESEAWDEEAGQWTYTGECDLRAWLPGLPGSKVRLDYERQVSRWVDGPAPFAEGSYRVAFDGRATKRLETAVGPAGAPSNVLAGELTAGRPLHMQGGDFQSGWRFSVVGAMDNFGVRLSDYLTLVSQRPPRTELRVSEAESEGRAAIAVDVMDGDNRRLFVLDPTRAYSLIGAEFGWGSSAPTHRCTVFDLTCVAAGVYYPVHARQELFAPDGRPLTRSTYYAMEVIANDPEWTDDVFDPEWPPGTAVNDRIAGTVYVIAAPPKDLEAAVDKQIGEVLEGLAAQGATQGQPVRPDAGATGRQPAPQPAESRPTTRSAETKPAPHADTKPSRKPPENVIVRGAGEPNTLEPPADEGTAPESVPQAPRDTTGSEPSRSGQLVTAAVVLAGLAVAAVVVARRWRGGALILILCALPVRSAAADDRLLPLSLPTLKQQKLSNCGLHAAVFACR